VIVSVPHGGTEVPKKVKSLCRLNNNTILRDGDTWSRELYAVSDQVACYVDTTIARAVLDMNRAPDDRPPDNSDGVVKTVTVDSEQIWQNPQGLPDELVEELISNYHKPYHKALVAAKKGKKVVMGIDCHTMLTVGPTRGNEKGVTRPLICISNGGDNQGALLTNNLTASQDLILALKEALIIEFTRGMDIDGRILVGINEPFKGGYITKHHGNEDGFPWLQVEINRELYLPSSLTIVLTKESYKKLEEIRCKFLRSVRRVL